MRILLSNDDGFQAPGLSCLYQTLKSLAHITIVAPDRDRSGASNSLTLNRPLRAIAVEENFYKVDGTPTDCVHLAITGLLEQEPDMVISGINSGANMGDDVLYSGTVAAAMEGRSLGFPAIAVSLVGHESCHYQTAATVVEQLVIRLRQHPLPNESILNINVPDVPLDQLAGYQVTRLGQRHRAEGVITALDPRGRTIYWVGPAGEEQDAGPGTDFYAVKNGFVSITPLHFDLTRHSAIERTAHWFKDL